MEFLTTQERIGLLREARAWMEAQGLGVAPTRVARYIREFSKFASMEPATSLHEDEATEYLLLLREIDELIWIYRGLRTSVPPGVLNVLEAGIGGAPLSRDDAQSNPARNRMFELRIASHFLQAGFNVDMSQDCDLVVQVETWRVFIECKRLDSLRKVQTRTRDAVRQIQRRLEGQSSSSFGLVAIDASKVLHPKQGLGIGPDQAWMQGTLRAELVNFEEEFSLGDACGREPRIVSLWLQTLTPVIHLAEGHMGTRFSSFHVPFLPEFGEKRRLFERLKRAFEVGGPTS